jgi:hypothetical protein
MELHLRVMEVCADMLWYAKASIITTQTDKWSFMILGFG